MFKEMLAALPTTQSDALRMEFYRGLSHREMARETGIPLGTIKTRLKLGVRRLRGTVSAIGFREEWLSELRTEVGLCDPSP